MRIAVISDTHNFLDPQIPKLFAGVDHILHAGDIGAPVITVELEQIAPVTAVGGNTDDPGCHYPLTKVLELAGHKFLLHHIVNPHAPTDSVRARLARERFDVVVFGHTHKPFSQIIGGTLYFNPGYAGKPRFGLERSVAVLHCEGQGIRPEYSKL
jgi:putative phosphoesterase